MMEAKLATMTHWPSRALIVACALTIIAAANAAAGDSPQPAAAALVQPWSGAALASLLEGIELPPSQRRADQGRVVILGLDGLTGHFYKRYIREGIMPNVQQLMARGSSGILNSTVIPSSAVAWTAAMSGVASGRSGISSFFVDGPSPGQLRLVNGSFRRVKALWDYLDEAKRVSVVINVPGTFPPVPLNGLMVTGLLSQPGKPFTHPPELGPRLLTAGYLTSDAPIAPVKTVGQAAFDGVMPFQSLDSIQNNFLNQAQLALHLYRKGGWDLLFIVFTITDRLQHSRHLLPEEMLRATYVNLDRVVGSFAERLPADTHLVLCSDHGFRPYPRALLVNQWLVSQEFAKLTDGQIDTGRSTVVAVDTVGNYAALRILAGTAPADSGLRQRVLSQLTAAAGKLIDPATGGKVVRQVIVPGETARSGSGNLVDVILELEDDYMTFAGLVAGEADVVELQPHIYDHELRGFYTLAGPRIARRVRSAAIEDICPAALYLLDEPIPGGTSAGIALDGRVHRDWLAAGARDPETLADPGKTVLRQGSVQQSEASEEVMDRLRALGYVQ